MRIDLLALMIVIFFTAIFLSSKPVIAGNEKLKVPKTVENVDIRKYAGLWYEIAKIPNRFQRKCAANTTAFYSIREDGRINVVNSCTNKDGDAVEVKGIARVADKDTNAKLEVSFVRIAGFSLFWGDYWILGLGEEYDYAVVGSPDRKYGWILSRQPSLSRDKLDIIFNLLREQGYNPDEFEMSVQSSVSD